MASGSTHFHWESLSEASQSLTLMLLPIQSSYPLMGQRWPFSSGPAANGANNELLLRLKARLPCTHKFEVEVLWYILPCHSLLPVFLLGAFEQIHVPVGHHFAPPYAPWQQKPKALLCNERDRTGLRDNPNEVEKGETIMHHFGSSALWTRPVWRSIFHSF